MHGRARALGTRSAVVFRPFNSWIRSPVLGAGVEPATDDLSGRCSTRLSYPVVVMPGVEPGPLRDPSSSPGICRFRQRGMDGTDGLKPGCRPPAGFTNPWPVSVCLPRQILRAPEPFSSDAILLAGARPAIRVRRHGCAGLRAENPRNGSARTAGTPEACPLPPACGQPCGCCTGRRR